MAFTTQTVTHKYINSDQTPASGSVEFTLSIAMTNDGVTMTPGSHVSCAIDSSGNVSQVLTSTLDTDTVSQGTPEWRCTERVTGAGENREWFFRLPAGPGTVDLGTLMPQNNPAGTPTEAG